MNKLLSALVLAAFATTSFAASHAGGAPMAKASEPAKKAEAKKDEKKMEAPAKKASEAPKK